MKILRDKKKIGLMLDDAITIEVLHLEFLYLFVVIKMILMEELLFLENQIRENNLFNFIVILDQIKLIN